MKIGLISDTHDNIPQIKKAVKIFNNYNVDFVLHAGDYVAPFSLKPYLELNSDWLGVFGNNDGEKNGLIEKSEGKIKKSPLSLEIENKKIVVVHDIQQYNGEEANIIVYGHSHKYDFKKDGKKIFINPGEASGWLYKEATIAIVNLKNLNVEKIKI
jgi:hypothetical protein